jgi:secreted trypsin-like serine protease
MLRFVLLFAAYAASLTSAAAIVGGSTGGKAWQHSVMITSRGGEVCSGTLIARDLVITAAHCVVKTDRYAVSVGGVALGVTQLSIHPRFRTDSFETRRPSPDLAILKLNSPAPSNIRAAPISQDGTLPARNTRYLIAGFGVVAEGDRTTVGTLRSTPLPSIGTTGGIMVRLGLPDGSPPRGSCDGDSGGSVYREESGRLVLHAVIGWATGRTSKGCGAVTGATLVGPQLEWIRATAKRLGSQLD